MSDELLKIIHDDVKEIKKDIGELKVTSGKQQVSLDVHIKRSDSLETIVQHLDEVRIQPLEASYNQMKGIYLFLGVLGTLATIGLVFVEFFKK